MLDRMVEKTRQQDVLSRETRRRSRESSHVSVPPGLSYRKIEPFVDRSYEAIRQWFYPLEHLFEPDCRDRQEITVDETTIQVDGEKVCVWTAVDCDTLEVLDVDVSSGRSSLDALLVPKEVLERCRRRPLVRADRGPWETGRWNSWSVSTNGRRGELDHSSKPGSGCSQRCQRASPGVQWWKEAGYSVDDSDRYSGTVSRARKRSVGRAVRQPAPESGDAEQLPPTLPSGSRPRTSPSRMSGTWDVPVGEREPRESHCQATLFSGWD
jgi:putative transposase